MDKIIETYHAINHKELEFYKQLGLDVDSDFIFFTEPLLKRDRKGLPEGAVDSIQDEVGEIKSENKDSKVLAFVQFPKGSKRELDNVERAMRCSMFDGSDGVLIYETYPKQTSEDFSEELEGFLEASGEAEKYLVLEIDAPYVKEKLAIGLNKGLRNIILIAGAYKDNDLWIDLLEKIRKENAKSFVVFLKRLNARTKEAYMTRAVTYGADVIVHGAFMGRKPKKRVNYYFDKSDGFYKEKSALPQTSVLFTNKELKKLSEEFQNNTIEEYPLSRVCSVEEGRLFCAENKRKITLETEK